MLFQNSLNVVALLVSRDPQPKKKKGRKRDRENGGGWG